jgi:hypothetical protein
MLKVVALIVVVVLSVVYVIPYFLAAPANDSSQNVASGYSATDQRWVPLWNECGQNSCVIHALADPIAYKVPWMVGSVPDTFDLNITYTASAPINVYIFSLDQYNAFANCQGLTICVAGWYFHYQGQNATSLMFYLAEGCAQYVMVFASPFGNTRDITINPNVLVAHDNTPFATGVCAAG